MKMQTALVAATLALTPALAMAQGTMSPSTTSRGAADGAAAGGQIGGPVGAAVGGTVGAAVGAAVEIPNAVIMSITGANEPSVIVEEEIVVGEPLPREVEIRPVPNHRQYSYAIVNDHRVIVEPRTRRVLRVID
jgi:hypothetical protein